MEITSTSATTLPAPMVRAMASPREDTQKAATSASAGSDAAPAGQSEAAEKPSDLKSFAFGLLDLDKPEQQAKETETDSAYTTGKWVGAAAKVGALISLLV